MKIKYLFLVLFLPFVGKSQTPITYTPMTAAGYQFKYVKDDSGHAVPFRDTSLGRATTRPGSIVCNSRDSIMYYWTGRIWAPMGGNSKSQIVYVELPLFVTTDSAGNQTIHEIHANGIVSGGIVTRGASCFSLQLVPTGYYIGYKRFQTPATDLTVPTPDGSFPRTDEIIVDSSGNVFIRAGTPSSTPVPAGYNPSSELVVATYTVGAGATCVGIMQTIIYNENVEWTITSSGTITYDANNTNYPLNGSKDLFVSKYSNGSKLIFTHGTNDTASNTSVLKFPINLNGKLFNQIQAQFFNGSTAVGSSVVLNPYFNVSDSNEWQLPVIPLSAMSIGSGQIFNKLVFTFAGYDTSGAKGLYFDYLQLQKGQAYSSYDYSDKVDSVTIASGNVYWWAKGISHLVGTVTSSGGSPNSNIGSGYRLAIPNTNNIKTLFAGTNITMDSTTNANGITINSTSSATIEKDTVAFNRTAVKTSNYTALVNDLVPVNTTSGNVTITLPTAPINKSRVAVKKIISGSADTVKIVTGGSDVFNRTGGGTQLNLVYTNQGNIVQYDAANAIWTVLSDDLPLSGTDSRYQASIGRIDSIATATAGQTAFTFVSVPIDFKNFKIYVNGEKWAYPAGYTFSGNVITLTTALYLNDTVEYLKEL